MSLKSKNKKHLWQWPCPGINPKPFPTGKGFFGMIRKYDIHSGVDIYCDEEQPVHAVEDGIVIGIEDFTGSKVGSSHWLDTRAVLIEGVTGVVCYGEIQECENINVGDQVKSNQLIGHVKRLLKTPGPTGIVSMLHLELYCTGHRTGSVNDTPPDGALPDCLCDPTPYLREALGRVSR